MIRVRCIFLVTLVSLSTAAAGCKGLVPMDSTFGLTVENNRGDPVRMRWTDERPYRIPAVSIAPCSQYTLGSLPFRPGQPEWIEIRDSEAREILTVEEVPTRDPSRDGYWITVAIPETSPGECPEIAIIATPTPPAWFREMQPK